MVVFKVVFFDKAGQLPNYRIYSPDNIPSALKFVQNYSMQAQEVWICESGVADSGSNFGGRVTLPVGENLLPSVLEIVWFTSPRKIEEFQDDNFQYPFLIASKHSPSLQFTVDKLHIPEKYLQYPGLRDNFIRDAQWVLASLHYRKEAIETLKIILSGAGAKEISLEFKSSRNRFSIIDWDTEIETSM